MKQVCSDQNLFTDILIGMLKTFVDKNIDYGCSYASDDVIGVVVRLGDKLHRLKTISRNGYQIRVKGETLQDTLKDIANYSVIALMLMQKKDGKKKSSHCNH